MRNALWIIIAIVLLGGGYWWWSMSGSGMTNTNPIVNEGAESPAPGASGTVLEGSGDVMAPGVGGDTAAPTTVTVAYDGAAYTPSTVTIKAGDTVIFKNTSGKNMWTASDEHPTHTEYDGSSRTTHCAASYTGVKPFDQCAPGTGDYSFTFTKVGAIEFHDHLNPSAHGSVTVQ